MIANKGADLLSELGDIATQAGKAILEVYQGDFAVQTKQDRSPLTQADLASHELIRAALEVLTSMKRAGATFILTYFAKDACKWLQQH